MTNLKHLYLQNVLLASYDFNRLVNYVSRSKLKTLEVDQNYITKMLVLFHRHMPNLEKLSLAQNQLPSSMELLSDILSLKHLKYVNLSGQNRVWSHQSHQRYRRFVYTMGAEQPMICFTEFHRSCPFTVPENLTSLDLPDSAYPGPVIPELILMNNNTLRLVNLSFNAIQHLPRPFYCAHFVKPAINVLDLSNNKIECITSSFFSHCNWSSLNFLKLNQNQMKRTTWGDCSRNGTDTLSFIKLLLNLTKLDLSGNELDQEMSPKTFENQDTLEQLMLSNMRMNNFTFEIGHMTKLRYLDISSNNIKCLSQNTTKELKNLNSNLKGFVQINLQNNPLQCSCDCYSFLKWFQSTDIEFTGKNNLFCVSGRKRFNLSNISKILVILDASCYPKTWLSIMIGVEVTMCFIIVLFALYHRHKYRIYFFYLKSRISLLSKIVAEDVKQFHAFISYASPDRQWVKKRLIKHLVKRRKLKLFVASRDFEPGKLITANIHSAITTSAKTVFLISKSFLKSEWCLEEFSMALTVSTENSNTFNILEI